MKRGIIERIGKGKFKLGKTTFFVPDISNKIFKLNKTIKTNFPFITYCIWSSRWINEFSQHISKTGIILADIERDSAESVYHSLKESPIAVFYKPGKELLYEYINGLESAIIIRHLVSEAPVQKIRGVTTVSIEKLLIDIFCDNEFEFVHGGEIVHIFENAFNLYSINQSKLLRYAERKKKKKEIIEMLNNHNLSVDM